MFDKKNKNDKKDIKEWAKELKHNEKFAKKYEGLKTVEGILATAKKDGYDIKKEELMEFDLDSVAGGALLGADVNTNLKANATVKGAEVNANNSSTNVNITTKKASMNIGQNAYNSGGISIS